MVHLHNIFTACMQSEQSYHAIQLRGSLYAILVLKTMFSTIWFWLISCSRQNWRKDWAEEEKREKEGKT